jgi:hypothetical protein
MILMSKYTFLAMIVSPSIAFAALFGADNYNDCLLENMKGVTSNAAAGIIATACRNKFPESDCKKAMAPKMYFDVQGALSAGYSKAEIADFLAGEVGFDADITRNNGYSDDEIISYLIQSAQTPTDSCGAKTEEKAQ